MPPYGRHQNRTTPDFTCSPLKRLRRQCGKYDYCVYYHACLACLGRGLGGLTLCANPFSRKNTLHLIKTNETQKSDMCICGLGVGVGRAIAGDAKGDRSVCFSADPSTDTHAKIYVHLVGGRGTCFNRILLLRPNGLHWQLD